MQALQLCPQQELLQVLRRWKYDPMFDDTAAGVTPLHALSFCIDLNKNVCELLDILLEKVLVDLLIYLLCICVYY